MSLWFEKYRPKDLTDMIVSENKLNALDKWFTDFKAGTHTKRALLFTGPPGLGKTTLAHIILKKYGYTVKEFNATDIRTRALLNEHLDGLTNFRNINCITEQKEVVTGIIMDELDGMFKGDRGGIDELLNFITMPTTRNKKKTVAHKVPIICICNIGNVKKDIIKQLQKECTEINFTTPDNVQMNQAVERIMTAENMKMSKRAIDKIITFAQGDFRRLVNLLEFSVVNYGTTISVDNVEEICNILIKKEQDIHITDNIKRILNEHQPFDVTMSIYNGDKSKVPMVVHQNYINAIHIQKTTYRNKINNIKQSIDSLVMSDILEKVMYTSQSWNLQNQHGIACTHIPNYYINKHKKEANVTSTWASILTINSQSQNLKKNFYEIIYRIPGRRSYTITDVQLLIEIILSNIISGNYEKAVQITMQYNIFDIQEFRTKKSIAVFEKLLKFIKTVSYQTKWIQFKENNKKNKDLDNIIKQYIEKYNTDVKVKSTCKNIEAKLRGLNEPPPVLNEPPFTEPPPLVLPSVKKKLVLKKKIKVL
jgi:replication factor C subunit 1